MNVPTIPRQVAKAIERLRSAGADNQAFMDYVVQGGVSPSAQEIRAFALDNFDTLLAALVNGYEIEKTADEVAEEERQAAHKRIAASYSARRRDAAYFQTYLPAAGGRSRGYAEGIKFTINELGIKIEGVNA